MRAILLLLIFISSVGFGQDKYIDSFRQERKIKQEHLQDAEGGVLTPADLKDFKSVDYFDVDTNFRIKATWTIDKGKKFKMPTSTEREPIYRRFGYITFSINSLEYRLTVYQNMELRKKKGFKNYFFIPFRDETSGITTYGGGRYIDTYIHKKDTVLEIDFNQCYNPYCAYSHRYSCPIPPSENTLEVEVNAGEKTPIYRQEH